MHSAEGDKACRKAVLGDTNPALVAVYTLLTFGLYLPIWYWSRLGALNRLPSAAKINGRGVFALLCLYAVNASGILSFVGGTDVRSVVLLSTVGHALTVASGMILVALRLRVREILLDCYGDRFSSRRLLSWVASAVLGEIYLQARLNRLPPPRPDLPAASPTDAVPLPAS